MTTESKIALELQKIGENKLTRDIIIPLLESMGYDKVEFNGGPKEDGKDIILWDKDRFENRRLSVAQVKHFKATNTAADNKSFQGIVNQLGNCFSRSLLFTDHKPYSPSEVLFITSFPVDTATLHTRFTAEWALKDSKVMIIDGLLLAELLIKHKPEIVRLLIGVDHDIASKILPSLNNQILLSALGHQEDVDLQTIYSHIDFSLGKQSTQLFFSDDLTPVEKVVNLGYDEWLLFKHYCKLVATEYTTDFMSETIDVLDHENKHGLFKHAKWEKKNRELEKSLQKVSPELSAYRRRYGIIRIELDKLSQRLKDAGTFAGNDEEFIEMNKSFAEINDKLNELEAQRLHFSTLLEGSIKSEPKLVFQFDVNGTELLAQISEKRIWIEQQVKVINSGHHKSEELRKFITRAKSIIDATEIILENATLFQGLGRLDKKVIRDNYESTTLKLNIQELFDTGHNFIVLGDAGAGKTTTLQKYAYDKIGQGEGRVLWLPLARLISNWVLREKTNRTTEFKNNLETGITLYLNLISININLSTFIHLLQSQKMVLLLDGIDEAIKIAPWLPDAIVSLSSRYSNNLQLIVSTRRSSTFLGKIPFFSVTLLPFTIEQRDRFIEIWFQDKADEQILSRIKKHLKANAAISEIIRNPLLTTTLCVLAKHKLPLPRTEINLYNDRIRLLTGFYDNAKNIHARISVSPSNLEILAQRIAFHMHEKNLRVADLDDLELIARKVMLNELDFSQSAKALHDLVDPCNILIPSEEGLYGFGHLRYQEHLAAKEISSNRAIDVVSLLGNPWWHEVLMLFSRLSANLDWLIRDVFKAEKINSTFYQLEELIKVRPLGEQENLESLLDKYYQLEMADHDVLINKLQVIDNSRPWEDFNGLDEIDESEM